MIYAIPPLEPADRAVLEMIHSQRDQLQYQVNSNPNRWTGFLRRTTIARAVQGSNSIEGYDAALADVEEIIDDEKPDTVEEETRQALIGYRNAMTYILRIYNDPHTVVDAQLIRSLHYIMLSYDLTKYPGQWRPGPIYVVREDNNERVYEAPAAELVPGLMDQLVQQINGNSDVDTTVLAAMAHLNLTMIHPFKDGNGRMARALQALLLTRDGILGPVLCSIEEWLGRNTMAYYAILAETGQGDWHPENSALRWVRFCLLAHYQQAATIIRRNAEIGRVWDEIEKVAKASALPERVETALVDAAFGYRVRNSRYREEHEISEVVASRDLRKLCDLDLLMPVGEKRGRYYVAAPRLKDIRDRARGQKSRLNPYDVLRQRSPDLSGGVQLDLPGLALSS